MAPSPSSSLLTQPIPAPALQRFAEFRVLVDRPQDAGTGPRGQRRLIPILGGEAAGDGWRGRILPGGADVQRISEDGLSDLDARYIVETDAGDLLYIHNLALRSGPAEAMARLARGEPVDPALIYFRGTPRIETSSSTLNWVNHRLFVCTGARYPDRVELEFFVLA